jgi:Zn-dependent metalloprotease
VLIVAVVVVATGKPQAADNPRVTLAATAPADVAYADRTVAQMIRGGQLRLRESVADSMIAGRTHERLDQYYRGVRVFGGDVVRQATSTGLPLSVFGQMYADIEVDPTPGITEDDAAAAAQAAVSNAGRVAERELVLLPLTEGGYALAYRFRVNTAVDRAIVFVDAHSGAVLRSYSNLQRAGVIGAGTGVFGESLKMSASTASGTFLAADLLRPAEIDTYDLHGNSAKALDFLNGLVDLTASDIASSTSNTWTDGADVDGHAYAGYTYDYYYKRFGRHGLDNKDLPMTIVIHPASRASFSTASTDVINTLYLNAFYAGDGIVVYGEGLPAGLVLQPFHQTVDYFSAGLDVVAHELSHGVTQYTSGLIYQDESGALNEAFSDIMGNSVKFFFQPAGTGLMQANYELGSDVLRPGGIRSFDNPAVFGDPDHYSKRLITTGDNGGVHTNCTIADHAFYLAVEGGTNRTSGLTVQGVGAANRLQMERVFYRGFTTMLPSSATFSTARAATIQAAADLYGTTSVAYQAVTQAWAAVGVN